MARITRAQKLRLGIFVIAGVTILVGGLVILAGVKLGEKRDRYLIRYKEAAVSLSGLDIGSPVKYSGIRVGRVDSVRIDPKDVSVILVDISLDHGTPVAVDTKADLGSQGITGLKYIDLTRGSASAKVRKPGDQIPPGSSPLDSLTAQAGTIATKVEVVLGHVSDLTGPDMKVRLARVLDSTEELLVTVNGTLNDNREALKTLAASASATAVQLQALSTALAGSARRVNLLLDESTLLVKNARLTPERVNAFLEQGAGVLTSMNTVLGRSQHDLIEAIAYVREAAENASAFTQKVRDDPTLLLLGEGGGGGDSE